MKIDHCSMHAPRALFARVLFVSFTLAGCATMFACGGAEKAKPIGSSDLPIDAGGEPVDAGTLADAESAAPLDAAVASTDPLLLEATAVGPFRIGMKLKELRAISAYRIEEVTKSVEGETEKVWTAFDHQKALVEFTMKNGKVASMFVLDRRFHTDKGVAIGSKASAIETALGTPTGQYTLEGETCFFFGNSQKIHFCFRAGATSWEGYAKKNRVLTSFIVSDG